MKPIESKKLRAEHQHKRGIDGKPAKARSHAFMHFALVRQINHAQLDRKPSCIGHKEQLQTEREEKEIGISEVMHDFFFSSK